MLEKKSLGEKRIANRKQNKTKTSSNVHVTAVPDDEKRETGGEAMFKNRTKNVPKPEDISDRFKELRVRLAESAHAKLYLGATCWSC